MNKYTFEDWLSWHFDRPSGFDFNQAEGPEVEPLIVADYLANLFSNAGKCLQPFSDAQVSNAFWWITFGSCGEYFDSLWNDPKNTKGASKVIDSFYALFKDFFAKKCGQNKQPQEAGGDKLDQICFMWFDNVGLPKNSGLRVQLLQVMEKILRLPNKLCVKAALHGLGHVETQEDLAYCNQVIDKFVAEKICNDKELLEYAARAKAGNVQ